MSNVLLTASLFTKLTLMNLGNDSVIAANMSPEYSKQFGNKEQKIGETFNVRKPQRFLGTDGLAYNPEAIADTSVAIKCDQVSGVHFEWDSFEKTLSLNEANNLAASAAIAIAAKINTKAAQFITYNTFNAVGAPGTIPNSFDPYLAAEDKLINLGMPQNAPVNLIVNRRMSSAFVSGTKALFNNQDILGKQHSQGRMVNQLGYNVQIDNTIYAHTTGAASGMTLAVKGASQTQAGGNNANGQLIIDGGTVSTTIAKQGDVFTITGVYSVDPQTKVSTQDLQQFVLQADATTASDGSVTLSIFPAITPVGAGQQYANVDSTPADNAVVKFWDNTSATANVVSKQGILLHKNAFAFLSVPLEAPSEKGVEAVSQQTDPKTGITIRFTRTWDYQASKHANRFDVLYGFGRLYPELACRIAS